MTEELHATIWAAKERVRAASGISDLDAYIVVAAAAFGHDKPVAERRAFAIGARLTFVAMARSGESAWEDGALWALERLLFDAEEHAAVHRALPYRAGYLQTVHWRNIRRLVFETKGDQCAYCGKLGGTRTNRLDVHHNWRKTALGKSNVGRERLADLTALCRKCHDELEARSTRTLVVAE